MTRRIAHAAQIGALVLALVLVPAALAAKGGGGGGGHHGSTTSGSGSLSLVLLDSTDGMPHYGQSITFNVSTTVTYPWVHLTCSQGGTSVLSQYIGFYAGYPWSKTFVLSSYLWPAGAADCNALLYDSSTNATLATMSFHVYA
jgi:hypothetical protein